MIDSEILFARAFWEAVNVEEVLKLFLLLLVTVGETLGVGHLRIGDTSDGSIVRVGVVNVSFSSLSSAVVTNSGLSTCSEVSSVRPVYEFDLI